VRGQIRELEKSAVTGLFPGSGCFTVPIFVHIGPAESQRQAKTWFWAKIRSNFELWPLRARSNYPIWKNAVTGLFLGSSCVIVPSYVKMGRSHSEFFQKWIASEWNLVKIGQILNFDLSVRGQIIKFCKNAVTGLFPGSSCFTVPIFVHIGPAESERQAKTWFWAKIRSNFELWPLRTRSN